MHTSTATLTIGERVAYYRRRRGRSQEVLAGLIGRTPDWLGKVENNRIELDRPSVIRRLADALDVTVGDLLAEPTLLDWTPDSGTRTMPALRAALMDYRQVTPFLAGQTNGNGEPPTLDTLRRNVGDVFDAYQASRYGYITGRVPLVLSDALHAAHAATSADAAPAQGTVALAYQAAASVLTKVGEADLAWIASEPWPHRRPANRQPGHPRVAVPVRRARIAVHRSLPCRGTAHRSRRRRRAAAAWPSRSVAAVGLRFAVPHRRDSGRPCRRQVRHTIETARAFNASNRRDDALGMLLSAERLAPEQIKHHAMSRNLVLGWVRTQRGPSNVALDQLALRLHLVQ